MVARAVRCSACRAKKIKCDRQWPQCGECRRGRHQCSGPPANIKFVLHESCNRRYKGPVALKTNREANRDTSVLQPSTLQVDRVDDIVGENSCADMRLNSESTCFFDDPELAPPICTSPAMRVASRLVGMASATNSPFRLGSFVEHIPSMLQSSPALTATTACCVDACTKNELLASKSQILDGGLYGKALNAIHSALDDPFERTSITTFLAVALMQRMETTFACKDIAAIPCWSVHAGGISELLRFRGVFDPNDDILFNTMLENFGPIVSHSVFREEDCFLATSQWQRVFALRRKSSLAQSLLCVVFSQLAFLPGLLKGLRLFQRGEDTYSDTRDKAFLTLNILDGVGYKLEESILPHLAVRAANQSFEGSPVAEMYVVDDEDVLRLISWHAVLSIMVSNIIITLAGPQLTDIARLKLQNCNFLSSTRIWKLSDEARKAGLMQYYFYSGAMATTYESANSEATRQWIIDSLNDLHGFGTEAVLWSCETVQRACDALAGRMPGMEDFHR